MRVRRKEDIMTVNDAIARADELRVNLFGEAQKAGWIHSADCAIAEMMGVEHPTNTFPNDRELLMPSPYDDVYVKYLMAMIAYHNGESGQYANDMELYNEAMERAGCWWIRNHRPASKGNWRVM
jgi:hypothetical protein